MSVGFSLASVPGLELRYSQDIANKQVELANAFIGEIGSRERIAAAENQNNEHIARRNAVVQILSAYIAKAKEIPNVDQLVRWTQEIDKALSSVQK